MNTPDYMRHKMIKTDCYNRRYGYDGWWYWEAVGQQDCLSMPPFPQKKKPVNAQ